MAGRWGWGKEEAGRWGWGEEEAGRGGWGEGSGWDGWGGQRGPPLTELLWREIANTFMLWQGLGVEFELVFCSVTTLCGPHPVRKVCST